MGAQALTGHENGKTWSSVHRVPDHPSPLREQGLRALHLLALRAGLIFFRAGVIDQRPGFLIAEAVGNLKGKVGLAAAPVVQGEFAVEQAKAVAVEAVGQGGDGLVEEGTQVGRLAQGVVDDAVGQGARGSLAGRMGQYLQEGFYPETVWRNKETMVRGRVGLPGAVSRRQRLRVGNRQGAEKLGGEQAFALDLGVVPAQGEIGPGTFGTGDQVVVAVEGGVGPLRQEIQSPERCVTRRVPDFEGVVVGGGEDPGAVGAEGAAFDPMGMSVEGAEESSAVGVPDFEGVVVGGGEDAGAVGAEGQALTLEVCPSRERRSRPLSASQTLRVLSSEAERMRVPSGLKAQPLTQSVCPSRERRSRPLSASQTLRVLSQEAERMRVPSGLKGGAVDTIGMSVEGAEESSAVGVPDFEGVVVGGGEDAGAVGAEGAAVDTMGMSVEGAEESSAVGVPDFEGVVPRGGEDAGAVGAEGAAVDTMGMSVEGAEESSAVGVPDFEGVVVGGGEDAGAVGAEGAAVDTMGMSVEGAEESSAVGVPDFEGVVVGGGEDAGAVGAEGRSR